MLTVVVLHVLSYRWWRDRCLGSGARADEVSAVLPGDDLLAVADIVSTRAISVDAPAALVWPWLVQFGPGRGGAYTYDWIENLFGLNMHSAQEILPQFQDLAIGDAHHLGADGPVLRVAVLEPERALVFRSDDGNWVWAFCLRPDAGGVRLISRNRISVPEASRLSRALYRYLMEPGSLVMERKMLRGIRERAERLVPTDQSAEADHPAPAVHSGSVLAQ